MKKVKAFVTYVVALILCIFVSIPVTSQSIVLDEAYSIDLVRKSVSEIIRGTANDVHPPLYYLLLKFSCLFGGESWLKYRIVTALASCLNFVWLGATVIRRQWGNRVSVFYLLWYGLTYQTLVMSTYIRMYSWGSFFVTAAAIFLLLYYENGKMRDYLLCIFMTLAAMYTHYYAVMAVFSAWVLILIVVILRKRERLKYILGGGVIIAIGYLPWLNVLLSQSKRVATNYWITDFDWGNWFFTPASLMEFPDEGRGVVLYFLVFAMLLVACLRRNWEALFFGAVFAGTMLIGAALSVCVAPIWQERYLYVAWGMLSLLVAIIAGKRSNAYSILVQIALGSLLCMIGISSLRYALHETILDDTDQEWVDFLKEKVDKDAILIVDDPGEHQLVFRVYCPETEIIMTEKIKADETHEALTEALAKSEQKQIWYIIDYVQPKMGTEQMTSLLKEYGFEMESVGEYSIELKSLEVFRVGDITYEE